MTKFGERITREERTEAAAEAIFDVVRSRQGALTVPFQFQPSAEFYRECAQAALRAAFPEPTCIDYGLDKLIGERRAAPERAASPRD